jgi:putative phage-type endonuclease
VRPFVLVECEQRSPEWFAARCGLATGSRASAIIATIKSGEAAKRRDYRYDLIAERLTGSPQESGYTNADMQRGIDLEPVAVAAYEAETGRFVQPSGFIRHVALAAGCSLDGQVDDYTGIVEAKAPRTANHVAYLRAGKVPSEHVAQVTHNLFISGAAWCDFVSYDPRLPDALRLFIVRVTRNDVDLADYETQLRAFLAEVDAEEQAMQTMADLRGQLTAAAEAS